MILRGFQRCPSVYRKNGESLIQNTRTRTHFNVISPNHTARCTWSINATEETFVPNKKPLTKSRNNSTEKYSFLKTQHNGLGRSTCYRDSALFGRPKLAQPTPPVIVGVVRQYSSLTETVTTTASPTYSGYFKAISESAFVEYVQKALISVHTYTGLPWWATIVLSAITLRIAISFPLTIYQHHLAIKLQLVKSDMDGISDRLKKKMHFGINNLHWNPVYANMVYKLSMKKEWNKLVVQENCHPMKSYLIGLMQIPLYACYTFALLNSCYMLPLQNQFTYNIYREFADGGFGWVSNLTVNDPYFVLPVISGLIALSSIEIRLLLKDQDSKLVKYGSYAYRIGIPAIILLSLHLPSGVHLFWITSSSYSLFETLIMMSPKFRRLLRIPTIELESEHPYALLRERAQNRFRFKRKLKLSNNV